MADVDLTPTAEMARNAERGLELRREHGRGGTEVGVARARDISNGKTLSPETVRRMHAFFSRHAKNKAGGEDDAGYIAWMLWGGDEGRDWAKRKVDALDRKEMNAMSETRKAIMERLGMAAGGEKQVFASSDDIMEMAQMLSAVESAVMHKRIEEAKSLLRKIQPIVERNRGSRELDAQGMVRAYNDYRRKLGMSRPGAKAKMARFIDVLSWPGEHGSTYEAVIADDAGRFQPSVTRRNRDGSEQYLTRYAPTFKTESGARKWLQAKIAEMKSQHHASRPGAKVRTALADACWEGYEAVGTKPQDGKTVPNCVPKMKAGRAEDLYRKLSGGTITNANVREWDRLVTEALRMPDFTPPGGDMSLHEIAEELGGEIMALKSRAAKAQAAKPAETPAMRELGRKMQELTQKADRLLRQSLSASVTSEQSHQMQDEVERISEQLDAMGEDLARQRKAAGFEKPSDLEREDVKAGLKLMSASDPAVSDKIRTLIKEGKPQDQAVAIALDMKRRGEL